MRFLSESILGDQYFCFLLKVLQEIKLCFLLYLNVTCDHLAKVEMYPAFVSLSYDGSTWINKSVTNILFVFQFKEITDKLPPEISESESFKNMHAQIESLLETIEAQASEDNSAIPPELTHEQQNPSDKSTLVSISNYKEDHRTEDHVNTMVQDVSQNVNGTPTETNGASVSYAKATNQSSTENGSGTPEGAKTEGQKEVIEQFEPGVYVTVIQLANGTKIFKRIRFRYVRLSHII